MKNFVNGDRVMAVNVNHDNLSEWIKPNTVYVVNNIRNSIAISGFHIHDNNGNRHYCLYNLCEHLHDRKNNTYGNWIKITE